MQREEANRRLQRQTNQNHGLVPPPPPPGHGPNWSQMCCCCCWALLESAEESQEHSQLDSAVVDVEELEKVGELELQELEECGCASPAASRPHAQWAMAMYFLPGRFHLYVWCWNWIKTAQEYGG